MIALFVWTIEDVLGVVVLIYFIILLIAASIPDKK